MFCSQWDLAVVILHKLLLHFCIESGWFQSCSLSLTMNDSIRRLLVQYNHIHLSQACWNTYNLQFVTLWLIYFCLHNSKLETLRIKNVVPVFCNLCVVKFNLHCGAWMHFASRGPNVFHGCISYLIQSYTWTWLFHAKQIICKVHHLKGSFVALWPDLWTWHFRVQVHTIKLMCCRHADQLFLMPGLGSH